MSEVVTLQTDVSATKPGPQMLWSMVKFLFELILNVTVTAKTCQSC